MLKNLTFPRSEVIDPVVGARPHPPALDGAATELPQVRKDEIEDRAVTFSEVPPGAVELQPRLTRAARTEPEAHHVFDAHRARGLLVELEPVELAPGKEIRVLASTVDGPHRILVLIALDRSAHFRSHVA